MPGFKDGVFVPSAGANGELLRQTGGKVGERVLADVAVGGIPSALISPQVSGSPAPEKTLDAGATNTLIGVRITVNPGDSVVSANRLMDGDPDVVLIVPGSSVTLDSDTVITAVSFVGIGTASNTGGGVIIADGETQANTLTAQTEMTFNSADNVHRLVVTLSPTWTSGQLARIQVIGGGQ